MESLSDPWCFPEKISPVVALSHAFFLNSLHLLQRICVRATIHPKHPMLSLTQNFALLQKKLEPSSDRADTARSMPTKIREYLAEHPELKTVAPHTRLVGSYGRSTAIKNIKDVDIVLFVDASYRETSIRSLLNLVCRVLKQLPEFLDDCGPVETRRQRRSVNVTLSNHDLSIDIVPVGLTGEGTDGILIVPDRGWDQWVATQPLGYGALLSEVNSDHNGKIVPQIKLWKHWRDTKLKRGQAKSYWLETLVVRHIRKEGVETSGKGTGLLFADLCDSIYDKFKPTLDQADKVPVVPDNKLGNNVAWNWERSHFETFMTRLDESRKWARRALNTDDEEVAVELWKRVFGDEFPDSEEVKNETRAEKEREARALGEASKTGETKVSPSGKVVLASNAAVAGLVSPPTRFFGSQPATKKRG